MGGPERIELRRRGRRRTDGECCRRVCAVERWRAHRRTDRDATTIDLARQWHRHRKQRDSHEPVQRWRECMGIEPTQPDVVRSRTVLKTRESHQAPSTPHGVTQARDRAFVRDDFTDLDAPGNGERYSATRSAARPRAILPTSADREQARGRSSRRRAAVDERLEVGLVSFGAAGSRSATPRPRRRRRKLGQRRGSIQSVTSLAARDVRCVTEETEAGHVGGATARRTVRAARLAAALSLHIEAYSARCLFGSKLAVASSPSPGAPCRAAS